MLFNGQKFVMLFNGLQFAMLFNVEFHIPTCFPCFEENFSETFWFFFLKSFWKQFFDVRPRSPDPINFRKIQNSNLQFLSQNFWLQTDEIKIWFQILGVIPKLLSFKLNKWKACWSSRNSVHLSKFDRPICEPNLSTKRESSAENSQTESSQWWQVNSYNNYIGAESSSESDDQIDVALDRKDWYQGSACSLGESWHFHRGRIPEFLSFKPMNVN